MTEEIKGDTEPLRAEGPSIADTPSVAVDPAWRTGRIGTTEGKVYGLLAFHAPGAAVTLSLSAEAIDALISDLEGLRTQIRSSIIIAGADQIPRIPQNGNGHR